MLTRREFGTIAALGLGGTAGCLDFVTGDGPFEASSEPVWVSEEALNESGYDEERTDTMVIERHFERVDRDVRVTNHLGEYQRSVELPILGEGRLGVFAVVSTPRVSIAGQTLNPVAHMDDEELAERFQSRYDEVEDLERVGSDTVTILGEEGDISRFDATSEVEGEAIDLRMHLGQVEHEEDVIVVIGAYPEDLADREEGNFFTLAEGVEHGE